MDTIELFDLLENLASACYIVSLVWIAIVVATKAVHLLKTTISVMLAATAAIILAVVLAALRLQSHLVIAIASFIFGFGIGWLNFGVFRKLRPR